jgi:RNA-directed DNA polymerase
MSLETPEKIRTLQRKLYRKATAEPEYRFYLLCDKICREDILRHAYALARDNAGAPGVDGESFSDVDSTGIEKWLAGLREEMPSKMYRPAPVRRVMIPKPGGGERPLGIPTIRDRVVQTPAKLVLEPIFEADLESSAYGYRPGRDATDAVKEVHRLICRGYTDVVDADLSKYFDSIPHSALLTSVARRIVDRHVLRLIKMWLKVPVEERSGDGKRRMSGGKSNTRGTPQGGVVSPMLANVYMNRFLKHWRLTGCREAFRAHVVSYADDFVILSRGHATEALAWTKAVMTKLGLTLNEAKTSLKEARTESFAFLGYSFGPHHYRKDGHWGNRRAILAPRRELARQYRHHRIVPQLVVVVEILVAERDSEHPLTDQGRDLMLDVFRTPLVVKAQREPVHHSDRSIGRAQQQRSCVGGDQPGIECRFHTATFHGSKIK